MTTLTLLAAATLLTQESAWKSLFDGKSMSGWESHASSAPQKGDWKIANGAIVCTGLAPGWLGTTATFQDFDLKLEFFAREKTNSGIFLRSKKEGQPHLTGYELQIWDFQPAGFLTGSLVGSVKANPTKLRAGQWNSYEIHVQDDHFRITLNGAVVLDVRDKLHPGAGVIGLQCQKDNPIQFRGIQVRALGASPGLEPYIP